MWTCEIHELVDKDWRNNRLVAIERGVNFHSSEEFLAAILKHKGPRRVVTMINDTATMGPEEQAKYPFSAEVIREWGLSSLLERWQE